MAFQKDVFICHASEDKEAVVNPIVAALKREGISYWVDNLEINWGDSITQRVNDGLKKSRFVIVILSEAFLSKNWPQRELNSILNIEASSGEVRMLPILHGTKQKIREIISNYPILNDKLYLTWSNNTKELIEALKSRISISDSHYIQKDNNHLFEKIAIPMPSVKRKFTQKEKDLFLKESYSTIKNYFKNALSQLEHNYSEIETDMMEVHQYKFISTIYKDGEVVNKCKIWFGGPLETDSISYQDGQFNIDSDNSVSDWLSITQDEQGLSLKASGMFFGHSFDESHENFSHIKAAEYLWKRFIDILSHS